MTIRVSCSCCAVLLSLLHISSSAAKDFCSEPLTIADGVESPKVGFSTFGELITVPGLEKPMIDIGARQILTIEDGVLTPFQGPPLDQWNRLMPVVVRWPDGEVWAYTRVHPALYRLDRDGGAFKQVDLDALDDITGFSASEGLRQHEDRRRDRSHDRRPPLFAFVGSRKERLAEVTRDAVRTLPLPRDWGPGGRSPIVSDELGMFLPAGGAIWFQSITGGDWRKIANLAEVRSLYSQSPFSMFQVQRSDIGDFWILLEDRVLAGRMEDPSEAPVLAYQIAGKIIIHEPDEQVLIFPDEPLRRNGRERPRLISKDDALYELDPTGPKGVPGDRIVLQRSGKIPFHSFVFHEPSGATLIAHSNGVAAYDGTSVRDLPAMATEGDHLQILRKIGDRYLLDIIGSGFSEIANDFSLRPIQLPETGRSVTVDHSPKIGRFLVHSRNWKRIYTSEDLIDFTPVAGEYDAIIDVVGDLPGSDGVMTIGVDSAYTIRPCTDG